MSQTADVDGMRLTMPAGWWVWKYDDSSFHRNQFQSLAGGSKAMDAVALASDGTLWLIELKDYRINRRSKPSSVYEEVAAKARATLAGLCVARVKANDPQEQRWAQDASDCLQIRIALQLAQRGQPSKLFPHVVDPADARDKLRKVLRPVDPRALCAVGDIATQNATLPWETSAIQT